MREEFENGSREGDRLERKRMCDSALHAGSPPLTSSPHLVCNVSTAQQPYVPAFAGTAGEDSTHNGLLMNGASFSFRLVFPPTVILFNVSYQFLTKTK